jgi:predicted dienelactone hydrolase
MGRLSVLVAGLILSFVAFAAPSSATDYTKPGQFAVGRHEFAIPGTSSNHPISTVVWYPATGSAPDPTATHLDDSRDAPAATTGPYPLVVVIHGLTGTGSMFGSVGRYFASHGFVVAAANYDESDPGMTELPWGDRLALSRLYTRPADVVRVIGYVDNLGAPSGKLAGVVDTSRVGVWGMSTGGTTALQAAGAQVDLKAMDSWCALHKDERSATYETCQFLGSEQALATRYGVADPFAALMPAMWDNRVAALVAAAPGGELHAFGDKGIAAVQIPALIMVASDDNYVSPEYNALWAYGGISSQNKSLAVFDHGGHTLFMGSAPHFQDATALATAFFLTILKGDPSARAALMPQAVSLPGVSYKTTLQ